MYRKASGGLTTIFTYISSHLEIPSVETVERAWEVHTLEETYPWFDDKGLTEGSVHVLAIGVKYPDTELEKEAGLLTNVRLVLALHVNATFGRSPLDRNGHSKS